TSLFRSAILYWHFVDVVWLLLFILIYWWGNAQTDVYNNVFFFEQSNINSFLIEDSLEVNNSFLPSVDQIAEILYVHKNSLNDIKFFDNYIENLLKLAEIAKINHNDNNLQIWDDNEIFNIPPKI